MHQQGKHIDYIMILLIFFFCIGVSAQAYYAARKPEAPIQLKVSPKTIEDSHVER